MFRRCLFWGYWLPGCLRGMNKKMGRITLLIYGMLTVSLIFVVLGVFIAGAASQYRVQNYDNNSLDMYNKLDQLSQDINVTKDKTLNIEQDDSVLDILGGFFTASFQALKTTKDTYEVADAMGNGALSQAELGQTTGAFKQYFTLVLLVFIVLGVFIAALMKWVL